MSEKIDDGGPAFPWQHPGAEYGQTEKHAGLSRRDWFATFAPEPTDEDISAMYEHDRLANPSRRRKRPEIVAYLKFKHADAMIAENKVEE